MPVYEYTVRFETNIDEDQLEAFLPAIVWGGSGRKISESLARIDTELTAAREEADKEYG